MQSRTPRPVRWQVPRVTPSREQCAKQLDSETVPFTTNTYMRDCVPTCSKRCLRLGGNWETSLGKLVNHCQARLLDFMP